MSDVRWSDPREYDERDRDDERPRVYDDRDPDDREPRDCTRCTSSDFGRERGDER